MAATGYTTDPRAVTTVEGRSGAVDVTAADVGLGNVSDTADADKPVSTAQQAALDGKAAVVHTHAAGDVTSGTLALARIPTGTSGSTVALGDHAHGVSTGGTGKTSVTSGSYLVGAGTSAMTEQTAAQLLTAIAALPLAGGTVVGNLIVNALLQMTAAPSGNLGAPAWKLTLDHDPATSEQDILQIHTTISAAVKKMLWLNERGFIRLQQWRFDDHLLVLITDPDNSAADPLSIETQTVGQVGRTKVGAITSSGRIKSSMYAWQSFSSFGANYSAGTTNGFSQTPYTARARLLTDDTAQARGGITVGASPTVSGDVMCNLPAALRPASPVMLNAATSGGAAATLVLNTNGDLICRRGSVAATTFISLDGLTWTTVAGV